MAAYKLHTGNCVEVLAQYPDDVFDSVVTDPPYELGFMGKGWDSSGIAYDVAMWAEVLRVLKPGGYLLAFGGTRTYHRMAVAIEDAGFEIRDSINWLYGSGFPKSHNLKGDRTGWGTALKPAHEPIVVARKPLIGTVAANVLEHGTGALNIDGCRVDGKPRTTHKDGNWTGNSSVSAIFPMRNVRANEPQGRWPANLVLTHHADCRPAGTAEETVGGGEAVWDCHPECPAAVMDEQANSSASRYFTQTVHDGPSFLYQPKANKKERDAGLDDAEGKTLGAKGNGLARTCATCGASVMDGCDCPDRTFVNPVRKNFHPTVKPISIMEWLVRLVTPPDSVVLDPFVGSGTTGIAAMRLGFDFVGIDLSPEYVEIAERRINHATNI